MQRVALIVNPGAGRAAAFPRLHTALTTLLLQRGYTVSTFETNPNPALTRDLALHASQTCDLVFACGGDGTVHDVVQGLAGSATPLGVLPFGTANALARNLHLPPDPLLALERLLTFSPRKIPLGSAETALGSSWFIVMAGAGPDGTLIREMPRTAKARAGRRSYYTSAVRLFFTRRFPSFRVDYRLSGSGIWHRQRVVAAMASRLPDLGGLFRGLTPASRLHHPHLLAHLLTAPAHLALPAWVAFGRAQLPKINPWLTTVAVEELRCTPLPQSAPVDTQVDAEAAGPLPLTLRIGPACLYLLMP